jgi:hypothetical protein
MVRPSKALSLIGPPCVIAALNVMCAPSTFEIKQRVRNIATTVCRAFEHVRGTFDERA